MQKFTVTSSTPSANGGFINKLVGKLIIKATMFGVDVTKEVKETFYIKTDVQLPVGTEDVLDFTKFDVVEREFIPTEGDAAGTVMQLKWLVAKRERSKYQVVARYPATPVAVTSGNGAF